MNAMSAEDNLESLLPQAKPMVLLSGYTPPQDAHMVDAWVEVSPASPFYEIESGGVPGCVALEYMAQSMALCVGLLRRRNGLKPAIGFVLGSRKFAVTIPYFKSGERYDVHAENTYQDESFGSFDCVIRDAAGAVVASAQMTAFQPDGEMTSEKLEEFS